MAIGLVVLVAPSTAHATGTAPGQFEIVTSHAKQVYGKKVRIEGQFYAAIDEGTYTFNGQKVTLEQKPKGASKWKAVASVTTANTIIGGKTYGGYFKFDRKLLKTTQYRVTFAGGYDNDSASTLTEGKSAVKNVKAARLIKTSSKKLRGSTWQISGSVSPKYAKRRSSSKRSSATVGGSPPALSRPRRTARSR
ncbi:MAG: hypothetical protein HZY75_03025 [Nocardioidaceae bacterium]|nr:MAG: hypothetical protein HZY75_03025 [Nocardioidaceae bacterium]